MRFLLLKVLFVASCAASVFAPQEFNLKDAALMIADEKHLDHRRTPAEWFATTHEAPDLHHPRKKQALETALLKITSILTNRLDTNKQVYKAFLDHPEWGRCILNDIKEYCYLLTVVPTFSVEENIQANIDAMCITLWGQYLRERLDLYRDRGSNSYKYKELSWITHQRHLFEYEYFGVILDLLMPFASPQARFFSRDTSFLFGNDDCYILINDKRSNKDCEQYRLAMQQHNHILNAEGQTNFYRSYQFYSTIWIDLLKVYELEKAFFCPPGKNYSKNKKKRAQVKAKKQAAAQSSSSINTEGATDTAAVDALDTYTPAIDTSKIVLEDLGNEHKAGQLPSSITEGKESEEIVTAPSTATINALVTDTPAIATSVSGLDGRVSHKKAAVGESIPTDILTYEKYEKAIESERYYEKSSQPLPVQNSERDNLVQAKSLLDQFVDRTNLLTAHQLDFNGVIRSLGALTDTIFQLDILRSKHTIAVLLRSQENRSDFKPNWRSATFHVPHGSQIEKGHPAWRIALKNMIKSEQDFLSQRLATFDRR